jgi:hypothetical protein
MKKIGLLCLALVLALGTLGVGYAMWSDTVVIDQTVQTGTVEVGVFGVTNYTEEKDVLDLELTHGDFKFKKLVDPVPGASLFGPGTYNFYESVTVAISNLYPSLSVLEDFVIGNAGSVPVKLQVGLNVTDPDGVYDHLDISWTKYLVRDDQVTVHGTGSGKATVSGSWQDGALGDIVEALESQQLHECDVIVLFVDKHLQQEAPQGSEEASFTLTVTAIQWNKY